jgi:exopolysaccharide biosynthesis polyprenyl glycosylphosphotransferase
VLQHRVPLEGVEFCSWTTALACPHATVIPRVNLKWALAILVGYDVACLLLYLAMVGVTHVACHVMSVTFSYFVWCVATLSLGIWVARATALYAKESLMKARNIPALTLVGGLATIFPPLIVTMAWAAYTQTSLFSPLLWGASTVLCLASGHMSWRLWLDFLLKRGCCIDRIIVLAETASEARLLSASVEQRSRGRLRAMASFGIKDAARPATFAWIENAVRLCDVDQIIVSEGRDYHPTDRSMVFQLVRAGADVTVVPRLGSPFRVSERPALTPDLPLMSGAVPPLGGFEASMKRTLDLICAVSAIIIALPFVLLIAAAIKFDSRGPVFFRQTRHGIDGRAFRIWKFRTMYVGFPGSLNTLQTRRGDPRVTVIGRFLRRTSLDEIPQLINVIRGEMSIVGPRPHAVGMLVAGEPPELLLNEYGLRHRMKPGITGWAQVNGSRGELDTTRSLRRRFALDRHYIENWSVMMDVMIILRTLALPFVDRHAF